jgi:molybdenum cofactor biosynthesis enzyme MoaA
MCHGLYVKANGELPCWDDVGEDLIFRTLHTDKLQRGEEASIFHSPELLHIRKSFMQGELPHPGVCERCAVRDQGGVHLGLHPTVMQVLHLESSYLCHLSCPQCIPAASRHSLKDPPYHMTVPMLDGLLKQLRNDGVESIRLVHFEGRGDPLMNPWMGELVKLTKTVYPDAFTKVTTHGSYPYKPWIVESGLDLMRVSIDGAFPENYEKYRVGGNLATALEFLRRTRDARRQAAAKLQVEWKYILFEWNDSDEEIRHAAELARDLDVRLRFTLTHSPGKSQRFPDPHSLSAVLSRLAPDAAMDVTFQLRQEDETADVGSVVSEHVAALLSLAVEELQRGDHESAVIRISKSLEHDPGLMPLPATLNSRQLVKQSFPEVLSRAKFPSTLSGFADVCRQLGYDKESNKLLRRYLRIAPNAPDRDTVRADLKLKKRIEKMIPLLRIRVRSDLNKIILWLRIRVRLRTRLRNAFSILRGNL